MAILDPVKVVIDNYPEGEIEYLEVPNNMENPELGYRQRFLLEENCTLSGKTLWKYQ